MKKDFKPYRTGTVFNKLRQSVQGDIPRLKNVEILFPGRLNAMAIDPSKIAVNNNLIYTPGEVIFSVKLFKRVKIILNSSNTIQVSDRTRRKPLVRHAYLLMKKALKFKQGMYIDVDNENEIKHCGLGSSSGLIAGVASAINEIYGNPIRNDCLVQYLAQNHGEEIEDSNNFINPVQCIGGSAASGLFRGGVIVLAGESCVIAEMQVNYAYHVVIGIPSDFEQRDSKELLAEETKNFHKFIRTGLRYGPTIAYNILHKGLPAMKRGDLKTLGDIIFDYRFRMGSIKNCSFVYPKLFTLCERLIDLKMRGIADVLAISSVGPGIFVITKEPKACELAFNNAGLETIKTRIHNNKYQIAKRKHVKS